MSNQVYRYYTPEEYLDPNKQGTPVSPKLKTWEEAEKIRNVLREGDPSYYYNIVHFSGISEVIRKNLNEPV
jgi:hypothetical protein